MLLPAWLLGLPSQLQTSPCNYYNYNYNYNSVNYNYNYHSAGPV